MTIFTVRLYAECDRAIRTEVVTADDAAEARCWAGRKMDGSGQIRCARIYDGKRLLSEVGYQIHP